MPAPADDALRMLDAGWRVAAVAVPVAVACAVVARWRLGSLCPRWGMPRFVWPGLAILGFFLGKEVFTLFIPPAEQAGLYRLVYPNGFPPPPPDLTDSEAQQIALTLKAGWLSLGWVPLFLLAAVVLRRRLFDAPLHWLAGLRHLPRSVALGVLGCLTFGTAAFAIQVGLALLFEWRGTPITEHPLSKLGANGDGVGGLLLVLMACVSAPLMEEFLFRGLLVPWAGGRWFRPWCLLFPAAVLAMRAEGQFLGQSLGFVTVLGVGAYLIQRVGKRPGVPRRTLLAVWSSAALFAAAHSGVWPTPIPLFVLGLGLGYLTARTRSWAASAVAHAMFNAVSTVWVLLRG